MGYDIRMDRKKLGQDFGDFMIEQGLYDGAMELAEKKLAAFESRRGMEARNLSWGGNAEEAFTPRTVKGNLIVEAGT